MVLTSYKNCLKYKDGSGAYVNIDRYSGGYPYPVSIENAHDFDSEEEALDYGNLFKLKFEFVQIRVTFEEIKD